jgi:2-deoxy-D-gluconate 3-dehydrogenase
MSLFDLSGKTAIVTGGNGGIGLGMARGLAVAGATVAVVGRNAEKNARSVRALEELGGRARAFQADLSEDEVCHSLVNRIADELGALDILVNNAGMNIRKAPQDYSMREWRLVMDTNLNSAFACCHAAYPHLVRRGGGKIINIGSMLSIFGASFAAAYGASKGGLVQMTRALACAWATDNIQVNAVLPGWIDTDLTVQARIDVPGLHDRVLARTPAGRWGNPEDLAGIAVFLSSSASDFVTGTAIPVDGGYAAQV